MLFKHLYIKESHYKVKKRFSSVGIKKMYKGIYWSALVNQTFPLVLPQLKEYRSINHLLILSLNSSLYFILAIIEYHHFCSILKLSKTIEGIYSCVSVCTCSQKENSQLEQCSIKNILKLI